MTLLNYIADLVAPSRCQLCSKFANNCLICDSCKNSLNSLQISENLNVCNICKQISTRNMANCTICNEVFGSNIFLLSLYLYKNTARDLVKKIKYRNRTRIISGISEILTNFICLHNYRLKMGSDALIIPAPSHTSSILSRGFNSTYYLSRLVAKKLGLNTMPNFVKLGGPREDNYNNHSKYRQKEGLREIDIKQNSPRQSILNKNIIIVDDVVTTGSTALGIAKELKNLGANKILIVSIARSIYYQKLIKKALINEIFKE